MEIQFSMSEVKAVVLTGADYASWGMSLAHPSQLVGDREEDHSLSCVPFAKKLAPVVGKPSPAGGPSANPSGS